MDTDETWRDDPVARRGSDAEAGRLDEVHALRPVTETISGQGKYGGSTSLDSQEVDLVLEDGSCVNVSDHADLRASRADAKSIARLPDAPGRGFRVRPAPPSTSCRAGHSKGLAGALCACLIHLLLTSSEAGAAEDVHTIDRRVPHVSTAPANAGEEVGLFLRERIGAALLERLEQGASAEGRVVLLVHGGITPSVPAFDLPWRDYSWMRHLAAAGFDVFAMDFTGYGHSPRPAMDDPCNLSAAEQARLVPHVLDAPCEPSHAGPVTTRESDWDELTAVVEYLRTLRGVERVSLLGWSLGGVRAGGFAARHPERVDRLVLYSPAYSPSGPGRPRPPTRPLRLVDRESLSDGRWQRAVACADQVDPGIRPVIWRTIMDADPIGASWLPPEGVKRQRTSAPTVEGAIAWDADGAARIRAPTLILAGEQDNPQRKRGLYEDMTGTGHRVLAIMECATHYALWERTQYRFLHEASVEWLRGGTLRGTTSGVLRIPAAD